MMRQPYLAFFASLWIFGICGLSLESLCEEQDSAPSEERPTSDANFGLVEVEPTYLIASDVMSGFYLVPYRFRRSDWGLYFGLGYSSYSPTKYSPNFVEASFSDVYSSPDVPLIEAQFTVKYNFTLGSIGIDIGVGTYENSSKSDLSESKLSFVPIRMGINFTLDNLLYEPYVAPYVSAGAYTVSFKESLEDNSDNGFTQAAPYFSGGIMLQLDWIDRISSRDAFDNGGVQNTFIFAEGRMMASSTADGDPDFGSAFHWNAGLRLEF